MKKIIVIVLSIFLITSCMDNFLRSRRSANMKSYPPEKMFEGKELAVARAIYKGKPMEVEQLIKENKIDINHISKNYGYTFLMYACILEDMQVMNKLLYMGADPNLASPAKAGGIQTPADHATALNNYKMLNLLLEYKADLNNNIGPLPLSKAMVLGGFDKTVFKMIDFLLEHGADPNHLSYGSHSVMNEAYYAGPEIINYLLNKEADPLLVGEDGRNVACLISEQIQRFKDEGRTEDTYPKALKLKQRLENEYHITFPVIRDSIAGYKVSVELYEKLPERDKKILGEYGLKKYEEKKKKLAEISKSRFFD